MKKNCIWQGSPLSVWERRAREKRGCEDGLRGYLPGVTVNNSVRLLTQLRFRLEVQLHPLVVIRPVRLVPDIRWLIARSQRK